MKKTLLFAAVFLLSFLAQAQFNYFKGQLSSSNLTTPNSSTAMGLVLVKYNYVSNMLELYGHYRGLTTPITSATINEAPANSDGPVQVTLTNSGGTNGWLRGLATITEAQEDQLILEGMYVIINTGTYGSGEIRAQLTFTGAQTDLFSARLQGAQEVPPTPSTAKGESIVLLDRTNNMLYLTGHYQGLTTAITGSHIHEGLPGVTGDVIFPIDNTGGTTGVLELVTSVNATQITQMTTGATYVNVHSGTYMNGEIRGQLSNFSQLTYFAGSLSGANQVPMNNSTAMGTVIVRYNPLTNELELTGDYQGLSSTITSATLNGPAPYNANGPVITSLNQTGGTTGTLSLSAVLNEDREADLYGGQLYVNVTTNDNQNGEIRVQLYNTSIGASYFFTGFLQGAQEVPPSGSTGTGTVTSLLDAMNGNVYVTGSFSGLTSPATMAHIHQALPGQSGPPIVTLSVSMATSGTVTGSGVLTPEQRTAMIAGATYVNIHTDNFPNGELRAQLGNLVLPVKLVSFNAFKDREKVALQWTTAQESNLLSYEIEQQDNETKNWIKKGTVEARGRTGSNSYRFSDVPVLGRSASVLYRLLIKGTDGKVEYSNVIRLNYKSGKGALTILSNPVRSGVLRFTVTGLNTAQKADVSVTDFNGRIVARAQVTPQSVNEISVGNLASGMYRLVVRVNNEVMQESFVK